LLGANAGVLLIVTAEDVEVDRQHLRIYQAEVLDSRYDFTVGQLQMRREWQAVEHEGLVTRNMTSTRDEIFWFVKELFDGVYTEALWRFDLVTNGVNRVVTVPGTNLNGLIQYDNIAAGIDFTSNIIMVSDPDQRQSEGWMIFPNITFGINTDISWLATVVEASDLVDTGPQVELWYSTDPDSILDRHHRSWTLMQRFSSPGSSGTEVPFVGVSARTMSLQLRLFSQSGGTSSPAVTRIALRGIPAHRDLIVMVPINVSDYLSAPDRRPVRVPGMGNDLHREMLGLIGRSVEALVLDPPLEFRGIVNNVSEPVEFLAPRGSVTRYCYLELRGNEGPLSITYTSDDGIGLGLLGVSTIGLGQTEQT